MAEDLAARYGELQLVDQELLLAEQKLLAAHRNFAARVGPRPDGEYSCVLSLRAKTRDLMTWLGDEIVRA